MKVVALLRSRETGQEGRYTHELPGRPWSALWLWTEGNYSCDCNRSLFLFDIPIDHPSELPCSRGEPTIELVELVVDGERLEL